MERNLCRQCCKYVNMYILYNMYNTFHKHKLRFTHVYNDLCVAFEDSQACDPVHTQIRSNLPMQNCFTNVYIKT